MTVDTLTVVRRLEAAGTPRPQAEALADVLHETQSQSLAELATKADLALVRTDLVLLEQRLEARFVQIDARFEQLEQQFDARFEQLEQQFDGRFEQIEQRFDARFAQIDARFEQMEQRFEGRFAQLDGKLVQLEQRITIKLGAMMAVAVGAVAALAQLL